MITATTSLNPRQRAMLRAVADGRAAITCSCDPDLYVDGLPCCASTPRAPWCVRTGYLPAARDGGPGQRVAVALIDMARSALGG